MSIPLSVLLVEDSEADSALVLHELKNCGYLVSSERVCTADELSAALRRKPWDLVISDYSMPGFDGPSALGILKASGIDIPFILVSGTIGEEMAVTAMRAGAADYLLKGNLARLGSAVDRELREARDRAARRAAEDALAQNEVSFRQMAENVEQVFWLIDVKTGKTLYMSPSCHRILGISSANTAAPVDWRDAVHAHDAERVREAKAKHRPDRSFDLTYRLVLPDSSVRWVRERAFPVRDASGAIYRIVGTAENVTERKLLEEQLRQSQKMEAMGQLAGGVAHDFNNLLCIIQGYASSCQSTSDVPAEVREDIKEILLASERASDLTRQLLTFSRKQTSQPRNLDLNETLRSMTQMLQRALGKLISIELRPGHDLPPVVADAGMVHQVLLNLAVNARDAMPTEGGRIVIATEAVKIGRGEDTRSPSARTGEFVCISVTDNGSGIDPRHVDHIFEPFYTTKEPGKGTGLGLATVYGIVQQHNGWIDLATKLGEGTTFRVYLPTAKTAAASAAPFAESDARGGKEVILVVEDDEAVRELSRSALERYGYRVLQAPTGVAAVEVWRQHRDSIHLLLTDVIMPDGMTGLELAKVLQAERPELPVIFTSGYPADIMGADFVEVNFLRKPFTAQKLAESVRNSLDGKEETLAGPRSKRAEADRTAGEVLDPAVPTKILPGLRVLLAEDDRVNQLVARGVLKWYGYRVDVVPNGLEAVRAAQTDRYDLLLMDLQMPVLGGIEACRRIRAEVPADHQPWIVALTSDTEPGTRKKCLEAGMDEFYSGKPLRFEILRQILDSMAAARKRNVPGSTISVK